MHPFNIIQYCNYFKKIVNIKEKENLPAKTPMPRDTKRT